MKGRLGGVDGMVAVHFSSKHVCILVTILSGMCFPRAAMAADDGPGVPGPMLRTWRLNLEESIPPQSVEFDPFVVLVSRADSVLEFAFTAIAPDGSEHTFGFGGPADGVVRELPASGSRSGMKGAMIRPSGSAYGPRPAIEIHCALAAITPRPSCRPSASRDWG